MNNSVTEKAIFFSWCENECLKKFDFNFKTHFVTGEMKIKNEAHHQGN